MATVLYTSLAEIRSFQPCASGWKDILAAHPHDPEIEFPLIDCLDSNSFADVCWLLGRRKREINIVVQAAKMCAKSVAHLRNAASIHAAANAAATAATAAAVDATAAIDATAAATAAADAAAADVAAYAANAAADANAAAKAAYAAQQKKNKDFLRKAICDWQESH